MSRSVRLLDLLQILRRHRQAVSGRVLADELGISLRTLYRDIAALQAQGADIEGEPGVGYMLRPGYMLPPLMFSIEEIEALALGSLWVASRADNELNDAARNALAKIEAVLPADLKNHLHNSGLLVPPGHDNAMDAIDVAQVRKAIREERKLTISYSDVNGAATERTIWPIAIGYFEKQRLIIGWCELRNNFRHFRTDRVLQLNVGGPRYPRRRLQLLKEWRALRAEEGPYQPVKVAS
ncbi:helix-turn-helix transcriptional regulator [Rhizobium halophytocola]|uniref:DNA-binding transcriptional regulator YafY n=1 Tax=Rhizobium halophytocola TaxID=735519 RepID=A0ABS4DTH0_9HYPH|nr:YafY family protein [Rhizobium halophytocola]MBP1848996.1 putative DNA-binding transcriptional regulator YafY [Rhizobium halophytocola]